MKFRIQVLNLNNDKIIFIKAMLVTLILLKMML